MAELPNNPFAGRSEDWRAGYKAGIAAFESEMKSARERGLVVDRGRAEVALINVAGAWLHRDIPSNAMMQITRGHIDSLVKRFSAALSAGEGT